MHKYENLRRVVYGEDSEEGGKLFIPVCPKCSRYVKADMECFVNDSIKPNATCKKHGRVRMLDEGYFMTTEQLKQVREALSGVLCDPEGVVCISGSDGDRAVIQSALATLDKLMAEGSDRTFRYLYEALANEYCKENHDLYNAIAPLLGLKPFYGTCNKEQVIWAKSQEDANALPAGANIYKYVKQAMAQPPKEGDE